jgi:hypothetical protein
VASLDPNPPAILGSFQQNFVHFADCVIASNGEAGFLTSGSSTIRLFDPLPTPRPTADLPSISLSSFARDLARSPDDRYVLACGSFGISVIRCGQPRP